MPLKIVLLRLLVLAICQVIAFTFTSMALSAGLVDRELKNKVLCGYQGWFGAEGDGTKVGFDNYQFNGKFAPGTCVIDYWPDLSEFDEDELYTTPFRFSDGSPAKIFSSANSKTVDRHFHWMQQHGIDGIFLQRFGHALKPSGPQSNKFKTLNHRNKVLSNVRSSANRHQRIWTLMYDLTSLEEGDIENFVIPDFKRLVDEKNLRSDPNMILQNGKPVIAVWGIGFNDNRAYSLRECQSLVKFLKDDPKYGGNAVMLGVPYYWRELNRDAVESKQLHEIIQLADIVCPWSVGRIRNPGQVDDQKVHWKEDLAWAKRNRLDYLPVIYPGFSWENLAKARSDLKQSFVPRQGGRFLWKQATALKESGANAIYIAMFDEMNEGTCIFKCSERTPIGHSKFKTYKVDGVPPDHYLWLTGQIGNLIRNEISSEFPSRLRLRSKESR